MEKYTCIGCGYIFDETKGVPRGRTAPNWNAMLKSGCGWHKKPESADFEGIPAGTKWQDVPVSFACPSCGAPKEMFEQ